MKSVIVEDHFLTRDLLKKLLEEEFQISVVGVAESGLEALELCAKEQPQLIILDLMIFDLSGLKVIERLRQALPGLKILVLSSQADAVTLHKISQLELDGFVSKRDQSIDVLREGIQAILENRRYVSPFFRKALKNAQQEADFFPKILSEREQQILSFFAAGFSNEEVASDLGLSADTVRKHRYNIMQKVGAKDSPALIRYANAMGFWKPEFEYLRVDPHLELKPQVPGEWLPADPQKLAPKLLSERP